MKRLIIPQHWLRLLFITLAILNFQSSFLNCQFSTISAQLYKSYDAEHPVVIVCDWDFPPYEFRNDDGLPDGYNVQLLSRILSQAKIPFRFDMREWHQAQEAFEHHEVDLIIDPSYRFHGKNGSNESYIRSHSIVNYYKVKVAMRPTSPKITRLDQLADEDTLLLKANDYAAERIVNERHIATPVEYRSPKEAILSIANGRYRYFVWGQYPTLWKAKEMALDSLTLSDIDIPDGEMRVVGYDKELLDIVDDEYARLEQSGELQNILDTWFHPERIHNDTSPIALFVLAGILIVSVIVLLMSRLIRTRVKVAVRRSTDLHNMMAQAIDMGNLYVVEYDIETNHMSNLYGDLLPYDGLTIEEFIDRIHPETRDEFRREMNRMLHDEAPKWNIRGRWDAGTSGQQEWRYLDGYAVVEMENGKPRYVVNALRDVTREVLEERSNRELGNRYMKMFDSNLIAMSFYDAEGRLIDLNANMKKLCNFDDKGERFFRQTRLTDVPILRNDFDPANRDSFHVCQRMYYPELGLDSYVEFRIRPIFDERDQLRYYVFTARDVTAERTMYLEQIEHDRHMRKISQKANTYETQLQYLLKNSKMFVWRFTFQDMTIKLSRSLRKVEFSYSRDEYLKGIDQSELDNADENLVQVMMKGKEFNTIHRFNWTPANPEPCWYSLSGMPNYDAEGHVTGYFGVARDITDIMDAQQRLKQETARAEDSGRMKSAFLANMTHEIRTPLNAIVGFSDLLPLIDTQEERMEFIRIIRNNCDMLMRLINDILEASSMGQALAIEPAEIDFSPVFDDICQTLAQRVQEPGVEFVKDNPYPRCHTVLDKGRVQQVLTNFVTNAVKYTHQGQIRVGYHWDRRQTRDGKGEADGLLFYCLDTGAGIPKEKQASVFERFVKLNDFVQGTGLGLSICQAIADRCNGHIGVTSEGEGHGSTFWLWIPCEKIEDK